MYTYPSRITVKMEPMLQRDSLSGRIINYTLPIGHVFDLSTLRVHVVAKHRACPVGPISTIPSPAECLIETLNVSLGSLQLNQIDHYGQLFAAYSRYNTQTKDFGRRTMTSAAASSMQQSPDRRVEGSMRVVFSSWLGLLGSGALIDTSLRGPLKFEMTLGDESVTGTSFVYSSFLTIDELPYGVGSDLIPYADYRTSITPIVEQAPFGVIQTDNSEDHRLQYVMATLLDVNYRDPAWSVVPVNNLGFTQGFKHSRMNIHDYHFIFDGRRFTHNIEYWEYLDRLREAIGGGLELPLLMARGYDMSLDELCQNIWLVGESLSEKGVPDGTVEISFNTRLDPGVQGIDCNVLMIARYACFV
jgi:hypothetical protein